MRRKGREWAAAARAAAASREAAPSPPCCVCLRTRTTRGLVCPGCCEGTVAAPRKAALARLVARREELAEAMAPLLEVRGEWQRQARRRREMESRLREASLRATGAERELRRVRAASQQLAGKNERRSRDIGDRIAALPALRTKHLVHALPDVIRCHGLTHSLTREKLVAEQRRFLQQLLVLFPLQITALRSSTGAAAPAQAQAQAGGGANNNEGIVLLPIPCVSVGAMSMRVPESMEQALAGSEQTQQASAAALGYMLQLTSLLCDYLGAPQPYSFDFRGSFSSIWEPASGADPAPLPGCKPMPLHSPALRGAASDLAQGFSASAAAKALGGAAAAAAAAAANTAAGSPANNISNSKTQDGGLDAVRMLQRWVAMLCHATMGPAARACPEDWSPFATLAWMFAHLKLQNTETTRRIMAAATASEPSYSSSSAASPSARAAHAHVHRPPPDPWVLGDATLDAQMLLSDPLAPGTPGPDPDPDHPEAEEWDLVHMPYLPPPPSQPEEVEHWTRAMFTDALRISDTAAPSSSRSAAVDGLFGAISRLPSFGSAARSSASTPQKKQPSHTQTP